MKFSCSVVFISLLLAVAGTATENNGLVPQSFAGWQLSGQIRTTTDPADADSAYPAVLKEYGFQEAQTATYARDDGRSLVIKAARFNDATGAYGAFTFYRQAAMKPEQIGTKAASANERILFFRSNILVDAKFDRLTGMSAAELRELAAVLPAVKGSADNLPGLPQYLPKQAAIENSAKYILGPQSYATLKSPPLTAEQVGFAYDPEIIIQDYSPKAGEVTLTIVQYPTPQIAGERLRALGQLTPGSSDSFAIRRTGPMLVLENGAVGSGEARSLLNSVNYEAEVTWNEPTSIAKRDNIGNLILAVFGLIGILLLFSLIFGVFFGGFRILMMRLYPHRVFDRPETVEIIQLHIDEGRASK